jgi:hypothetical protein
LFIYASRFSIRKPQVRGRKKILCALPVLAALQPNLTPICELPSWASTKRYTGTSAKRVFQKNGIAKLSHFACAVHDDFLQPAVNPVLFPA